MLRFPERAVLFQAAAVVTPLLGLPDLSAAHPRAQVVYSLRSPILLHPHRHMYLRVCGAREHVQTSRSRKQAVIRGRVATSVHLSQRLLAVLRGNGGLLRSLGLDLN